MSSSAVSSTLLRLARCARLSGATAMLLPLALSACGSDGATSPADTTSTDPNADRLEITFAFASGPSQNIEAMDLFQATKDGRLASPFIATPTIDEQPEWSHNGSRLLFTRYTPIPIGPGSARVSTVWIANADGTGQRQLLVDSTSSSGPINGAIYFNNQSNGSWSPDGTSLVFWRSVGATAQDGLAIIGADGTGLRWLAQGGANPSWSSTGRIAFGKDGDIWTINPDGTGTTRVTTLGNVYQPRWSPDGSHLVFLSGVGNSTGSAYDVVSMRLDGTDRRTLATGGLNANPSWSPDGKFVLYEHLDLADASAPKCWLNKVPSSGGASVNLTPNRGVGYCGGASWRPF